ncbi:Hypothetical_protein [Hexamita inflata]|uniref:Hypothetical_protein n=1 Tax=Hexamita inflata TaxID=28002 RepID=A0AA86PRH3_9EUKA|nr:Hypothetical protein HINF_LOCUS32464 [Hexamita inflata]CAI9974997.1 Hypothetical protein HINF_LOCUS62642 [Hexamita inflata]
MIDLDPHQYAMQKQSMVNALSKLEKCMKHLLKLNQQAAFSSINWEYLEYALKLAAVPLNIIQYIYSIIYSNIYIYISHFLETAQTDFIETFESKTQALARQCFHFQNGLNPLFVPTQQRPHRMEYAFDLLGEQKCKDSIKKVLKMKSPRGVISREFLKGDELIKQVLNTILVRGTRHASSNLSLYQSHVGFSTSNSGIQNMFYQVKIDFMIGMP